MKYEEAPEEYDESNPDLPESMYDHDGSKISKERWEKRQELGGKFLGAGSYVDITGFEYVRGDAQEITGKFQEKVFQAILKEGKGREGVKGIVHDFHDRVAEGKVDVRDATQAPSFNGWDKQSWHVSAARYARNFLDAEWDSGDNVYCVYIEEPGYSHDGKALPNTTKYIGFNDEHDPPAAQLKCSECNEEWQDIGFSRQLEREATCPECGANSPTVDGCRVDWEKLATKAIDDKAEKLLGHLGWEDILHDIGKQNSMEAFL